MEWWWKHTDVRFQSPWKQSDWPLVVRAPTKEEASEAMDIIASEWPEETQRISPIPSDPQGGFYSEQEARNAASADFKSLAEEARQLAEKRAGQIPVLV